MNIGDLRFLVVEDHAFQRWLLANLLEALGARYIFAAADGNAALEMLLGREPAIDIVVTDLDMPGMDGMEFIRNVGAGGYPVSLVLATAQDASLVAMVETMAAAYGVSLIGSLRKPVGAHGLGEAIGRHRARSAREPGMAAAFTAADIHGALARGEFEPYFQPKLDMRTRAVQGAEALARWRHPLLGVVRPHAFIKTMEDNGLVEELTRQVVDGAVGQCRAWRAAGLDAVVSINLAPRSLHDFSFCERMLELVERHGLQPRHVVFELTESAAAQLGPSLENLSRLRMKGFGLAIDDYGTGYSSMERLAQIPFTELKVDQSFVKLAATNPSSRAALESSLEMAHKLRICAVAEGVESRQEWDLVYALGCDLAQGYLIAQPMEAAEFAGWVLTPQRLSA